MLMLILAAFPLNGYFITAGARSLVKLMVSLSSTFFMVFLISEQKLATAFCEKIGHGFDLLLLLVFDMMKCNQSSGITRISVVMFCNILTILSL
jgi:hypothetical protein